VPLLYRHGQASRDRRRAPQRALALALAEPEVVKITPTQYRQAVDLLASMIVSYIERRPERHRDYHQTDCGFFE
jgi:hypothetical protein